MSAVPVPSVVEAPARPHGDAGTLAPERDAGAGTSAGARTARRRLPLVLAASDAVGVGLVAEAAALLGPWHGTGRTALERSAAALAAAGVMVAILALRGVYRRAGSRIAPRVADDLGSTLANLALAAVCLVALGTAGSVRAWLPPQEVAAILAASVVAVPLMRELALVAASRNPANVSRVLIVGGGFVASYLAVRLSQSRLVRVVGTVDDTGLAGEQPIGAMADLERICRRERIDRIVVAFSGRHPARSAALLQELRDVVDIDVVVRYFELASWESRLSDVTGLAVLSIGRPPGAVARTMKRLVDMMAAAAGLLAVSPILAVTALAVRLESGGPILFRQVRVGRGRRPFKILKFRTMREPADGGPGRRSHVVRVTSGRARTPLDLGPDMTRVTRVGRFLRRSGIDELPQLVNVLRGEMSLVGPRPFIPEECASLQGSVERRFDVRPGMTGLWQVCGQHEVGFDELCRLDVQYATSWSIRGDLRVLARTPGRLLRGSR